MRFMLLMIPKPYTKDEMIPPDLVANMMRYNEEMQKAGILIGCDGLHPQEDGARVSFATGKPIVTDGPFPETKEVLGGFWMINVKSKAEAIAWAKKCPAQKDEVIEVRQIQEMTDFPEEVREELKAFPDMQIKKQ